MHAPPEAGHDGEYEAGRDGKEDRYRRAYKFDGGV